MASQYFRIRSSEVLLEESPTEEMELSGGFGTWALTYADYVQQMNTWARSLTVEPEILEEFVFGKDRGKDNSRTNPRTEILRQIITLLDQLDK